MKAPVVRTALVALGTMIAVLTCIAAAAAPVCPTHPVNAGVKTIQAVMATGRFVAYQPTSLQVIDGRLTQADVVSIREDLKVLRPRFDGLITYGSINGAEKIPDIAAEFGFRAVIMGIWDVGESADLDNVIAAARRHPKLVAGVSIGNERVFAGQVGFDEMTRTLATVRKRLPQLAMSTSEPFHVFLQPQAASLLGELDLMLAIVHPLHQPWFKSAPIANSADFVGNVLGDLGAAYCGPVLIKETGIPTAPAATGLSPALQADFYRALAQRVPPSTSRAFAYFSAFDAPWRVHDAMVVPGNYPEEAHWGLYTQERAAKAVIEAIAPLKSGR